MTRSRLPVTIAIFIAVGIAGYLVWQLRAERQSVAQLKERAAALELALRSAPVTTGAPPVATPSEPAAPVSVPDLVPVAAPAAVPATPKQQIVVLRPDGTADPDPTAGARITLAIIYGDIEKELGLSKEQMNALVQLTASGEGTPSKVEAILGDKYPKLLDARHTAIAQNRISTLRMSLASTEHPLTDQQAERLSTAIVAEYRRRDEELATRTRPTDPRAVLDYEEQNLKVNEASDERLLVAARSLLEPEQAAVLQSSLSMSQNAQRRSLQARRTRLEAGGSGAADPPATLYIGTPVSAPPSR